MKRHDLIRLCTYKHVIKGSPLYKKKANLIKDYICATYGYLPEWQIRKNIASCFPKRRDSITQNLKAIYTEFITENN